MDILAGTETEYGLQIEGRTPREQVDDSAEVVRSYPGPAWVGWDYRQESPRADLRGFRLESLAFDPEDAQFDAGVVTRPADSELRSDRVLPNGARLYNDHGHPEYSTPEVFSLHELARHDRAGELAVLRCAKSYAQETGRAVTLYKHNCDYHGASFGTHESYLCPRSLGFDGLYEAVLPILVARTILCGAGRVGAEGDGRIDFQLSQRADFLTERFNAETLFRRPIFNTRDEPHADPRDWIRLHVISCDANRHPSSAFRRVGLVKIAIALAKIGEAPRFEFADPCAAFRSISRDRSRKFDVELQGASHTTAYAILDSYLSAAERMIDLGDEGAELIEECRTLMDQVRLFDPRAARRIDWAAKERLIEEFVVAEGGSWADAVPYDLAYHDIDPAESLFDGLVANGDMDAVPSLDELSSLLNSPPDTRAGWRGQAICEMPERVKGISWSCLTLDDREYYLDPLGRPSTSPAPWA